MWQQDGATLAAHTDWVRDVAWAPNFGLPSNTLASAGQDGKVFIWNERQEGAEAVCVLCAELMLKGGRAEGWSLKGRRCCSVELELLPCWCNCNLQLCRLLRGSSVGLEWAGNYRGLAIRAYAFASSSHCSMGSGAVFAF